MCKFLLEADEKEYIATIKLGERTETLDREGEIIEKKTVAPFTKEDINQVFNSLIGKIKQKPPIYSAVSVNGKRLYEYARENIEVEIKTLFFSEETITQFDFEKIDYIADCIDSVTSKLLLCELAVKHNVKIISSMGTGNKLNCDFKIADISKTKVCPLARVIRRELKKRNIASLKCVYSEEEPLLNDSENNQERRIPKSISYVPSSCGLLIAGEIIKDLING